MRLSIKQFLMYYPIFAEFGRLHQKKALDGYSAYFCSENYVYQFSW